MFRYEVHPSLEAPAIVPDRVGLRPILMRWLVCMRKQPRNDLLRDCQLNLVRL